MVALPQKPTYGTSYRLFSTKLFFVMYCIYEKELSPDLPDGFAAMAPVHSIVPYYSRAAAELRQL